MAVREETAPPLAVTIDEARDWLRLGAGTQDAMIAAMLRSAAEACERFTGLALGVRTVREVLTPTGDWQRLGVTPVRAIASVEGVPAEGSLFALPISDYAIDIDSQGDGWVRVLRSGAAGRVRVTYSAGLADDPARLPEALRHGIVQLAGHLLRERDRDQPADPPATVAALWRGWRRMRL